MAGYSGTPLWRKLGYKNGLSVFLDQPPPHYRELLALPAEFAVAWQPRFREGLAFVHVFVKSSAELSRKLRIYRESMAHDGVLWISWPKKCSGVATDVTEDRIREFALPLGLVDTKVCAVDEIWSGLKLVIRKEQR